MEDKAKDPLFYQFQLTVYCTAPGSEANFLTKHAALFRGEMQNYFQDKPRPLHTLI